MLLSVKAAAERAGVSESLVYDWCNSGVLTHLRLGRSGKRGHIRIEAGDLDAFLTSQKKEGRQQSPSAPKPPPLKLRHLQL